MVNYILTLVRVYNISNLDTSLRQLNLHVMRIFTLTIASVLLLFSSCKNIEKMVDKGDYDQAIRLAVDNLEGKKNKKTKYVKALEKAYRRVNEQDMAKIRSYELSNKDSKYDRIYDTYNKLQARQETIYRLDPLVSKDGYVAEFKRVDYIGLKAEVADKAAEYHYAEAKRLLDIASISNKYAARDAYNTLGNIERFHNNYKDTDELYLKAYEIGVDHIGVDVHLNDNRLGADMLRDIIYAMDVTNLNTFWNRYHLGSNESIPFDYVASIEVNSIEPGYEREFYNTYQETAKVENGTKAVIDLNGNIVKDTLGNTVLTKKYLRVEAEVTEMRREKSARLRGKTVVYETKTNSLVKTVPIEVTHIFEDYSSIYRGDTRALSNETKRKLKNNCNEFPSDFDMVVAMTSNFSDTAYGILKRGIK